MKAKPTYVLGITESHCATAALLKDGQIIACASEERFTRKKLQPGIPKNAINYCLNFAKITAEDLGAVACADKIPIILGNKLTFKPPKINFLKSAIYNLEFEIEKLFPLQKDIAYKIHQKVQYLLKRNQIHKNHRIKKLQKFIKADEKKFMFFDHHNCHGAAPFYSSGFSKKFKKVLIFTADGVGDQKSATLSIFEEGKIKTIQKNPTQNSLGFFYMHITEFLGLKPVEDEYKVMGLAAYVPENKSKNVYKNLKTYIKNNSKKLIWEFTVNEFLVKKQFPKIFQYQRFDAIAAAAQKILEESLSFWIEKNSAKYNCPNVICGGGIFANIKANQKIASLKNLHSVFFMPSPGDESNAIGAAFLAYQNLRKQNQTLPEEKTLESPYLGPDFTEKEIEKSLKTIPEAQFKIEKPKNINLSAANLLSQGEVIARFSGRMEYGSRALGNRSILAHPAKVNLIAFINSAIKNRDFWMPFAPSIIRERAQDYLINHKSDSLFMNVGYHTTEKGKIDLQAAIHPYDKTARPQILDQNQNPKYYDLIKKFEALTGIGALLNTSFNLHGEPIVCSPQDALRVFAKSGLKYLILENYLISKNENQKLH